VRVASGEMEGIFACDGALARDILVVEILFLVKRCGLTSRIVSLILLEFGCYCGIGSFVVIRLRNLERREL